MAEVTCFWGSEFECIEECLPEVIPPLPALDWAWDERQTSPTQTNNNAFPPALAMEGIWMVTGAPYHSTEKAHVYKWDGSNYNFHQQIVGSDTVTGDDFGIEVEISGDTIVVAGRRESSNRGAVYVFTVDEFDVWTEQQKVTSDIRDGSSYFGTAVDIKGDWMLVTAPQDDTNGVGLQKGAAFIFERVGSTWTQKDILLNNYAVPGLSAADWGNQGAAISPNGVHAAIGARFGKVGSTTNGLCFLFKRSGGSWPAQETLTPVVYYNTYFGGSVEFNEIGDLFVGGSGAEGVDTSAYPEMVSKGAIFWWRENNGVWELKQKIQPTADQGAFHYPASDPSGLAASGDYLVVGDHEWGLYGTPQDNNGRAVVYIKQGETYEFVTGLEANPAGINYRAGREVAVHPGTGVGDGRIVIGQPHDTPANARGSIHVFLEQAPP